MRSVDHEVEMSRRLAAAGHLRLDDRRPVGPAWDRDVPAPEEPPDLYVLSPATPAQAAHAEPAFKSLDLLIADGIPAAPSPLSGIAYPSRLTLLAGREKTGKSTLASHLAAEVSRAGGTVAWLALDEPLDDCVRRLVGMKAEPERVHFATTHSAAVHTALLTLTPALVVVDHLGRLAQLTDARPDAGDAGAWDTLMRPFVALAHAPNGPAVVMLSQAGKASGQYLNSVAIGAASDCISTLERRESSCTLRSVARFPVPDYRVTLRDGRISLDALNGPATAASPDRVSVNGRPVSERDVQAVLAVLATAGPEGATATEWAQLTELAHAFSETRFGRATRVARERGFVTRAGRRYLLA